MQYYKQDLFQGWIAAVECTCTLLLLFHLNVFKLDCQQLFCFQNSSEIDPPSSLSKHSVESDELTMLKSPLVALKRQNCTSIHMVLSCSDYRSS